MAALTSAFQGVEGSDPRPGPLRQRLTAVFGLPFLGLLAPGNRRARARARFGARARRLQGRLGCGASLPWPCVAALKL
jgi:hypothetical protein